MPAHAGIVLPSHLAGQAEHLRLPVQSHEEAQRLPDRLLVRPQPGGAPGLVQQRAVHFHARPRRPAPQQKCAPRVSTGTT